MSTRQDAVEERLSNLEDKLQTLQVKFAAILFHFRRRLQGICKFILYTTLHDHQQHQSYVHSSLQHYDLSLGRFWFVLLTNWVVVNKLLN